MNPPSILRATWLLGVFQLLVAACGPAATPADVAIGRCTAGSSIACACVDGTTGTQTCREDGTYDVCRCGATLDAGIDGAPDVRATDASDISIQDAVDAVDAPGADAVDTSIPDVQTIDAIDVALPTDVAIPVDVALDVSAMDVTSTDASGDAPADTSTGSDVVVDRIVAPPTGLVINEVDYDQVGTDNDEFVEIYNGTSAAVGLANVALVLVNGTGGVVYLTIDLGPAGTLMPGQYLVVGSATVTVPSSALAVRFAVASNNVQNGAPDALALVDTASHTVLDALSYEGASPPAMITGFAAPVDLVEGTMLPITLGDSNTVPASFCRFPNGNDSNDAANDWILSMTPTPGLPNVP